MTSTEIVLGILGLVGSIFAFFVGRIFSQSEAILGDKRRIYEEYLGICPTAQDTYMSSAECNPLDLFQKAHAFNGVLVFYASPDVLFAKSRFEEKFLDAWEVLGPDSPPLHHKFKEVAKAYNDLVLEMRRDSMNWSVFGYHGKSRLPPNVLEQAKKNSLD